MFLSWDTLWPLIQQAGLPGLVAAAVILVAVFLLQFTDLLKVGWMRRAAVVVLSYLFAGAPNGDIGEALRFAITAVFATLLKLALDWLFGLAQARMQAVKPPPGK